MYLHLHIHHKSQPNVGKNIPVPWMVWAGMGKNSLQDLKHPMSSSGLRLRQDLGNFWFETHIQHAISLEVSTEMWWIQRGISQPGGLHSPKLTVRPWKWGRLPKRKENVFQPSIFRCKLAVSFRESRSWDFKPGLVCNQVPGNQPSGMFQVFLISWLLSACN